MGWARTLLLGDIGNRLDIADTEQDIGDIRRELAANQPQNQPHNHNCSLNEPDSRTLRLCTSNK